MGKPSPQLFKFMQTYKVDSDEVWEVRQGGAWAIKHAALERIAAEQKIAFDPPLMLEFHAADKIAVISVTGKQGERSEWSIGEAAPYNNKNAYPFAMAEKRAKDRVILKLLNAHGHVYSEEEAEDFKRVNPHVTRTEDIYDGPDLSGDIPEVDAAKMKVKDARPQFDALVKEMRRVTDPAELKEWGIANALTINKLPGEWPKMFRGEYSNHLRDITDGIRAAG